MFSSYDPGREGGDTTVLVTGFPCENGFKVINVRRGEKAVQAISDLQRPRLRFNWGYWDGAALTAKGLSRQDGVTSEDILARHFDKFYAYGFIAGCAVVKGQGIAGQSSAIAWNEFLATVTDPDLIFQVEVNP